MTSTGLPKKVDSLLRKSKKPVQFVLFRIPNDFNLQDMKDVELDLTDLKINSMCGSLSAIPDMNTNPDRASACPLIPDGDQNTLKCDRSFAANIQIIKAPVRTSSKKRTSEVIIKKEIVKKSKKIKDQPAEE